MSTTIPQRKITVVGAGYVGSTAAQLCAMKNLASEVVLIDILEGRPQGIALDLNQSAAVEGFGSLVIGTNDPKDTAGSDLLAVNAKVIISVSEYVRNHSPEAFVIVVTNPLDSMVHLARVKTGFPSQRVIGMAGVLDSARFSWFIAQATQSSVMDVKTMVLGAHGDSMVPIPQYCTVNGITLKDLVDRASIEKMAQRKRKCGAEIVNQLKTRSAC